MNQPSQLPWDLHDPGGGGGGGGGGVSANLANVTPHDQRKHYLNGVLLEDGSSDDS